MRKDMTEAELALKFIEYFSDYELYKEVPSPSGRIDIYAVSGPLRLAIEVKKQFSPTLIVQAYNNTRYANYSFVAIPHLKNCSDARELCRVLGIGVLMYAPIYHAANEYHVKLINKPTYRRVIHRVKLLERMKESTAGLQHNEFSEFKVTVADMEMTIRRRGGTMPIDELFKEPYHYSSPKHAKQAIFRLIKKGVLPQFEIMGDKIILKAA